MSPTPARPVGHSWALQPADMCLGKLRSIGDASSAIRTAICAATSAVTTAKKMTSSMGRISTVGPPYPCLRLHVALQHIKARSRDRRGCRRREADRAHGATETLSNLTTGGSRAPSSRHTAATGTTLPLGGARFGRRTSGSPRRAAPLLNCGMRCGGVDECRRPARGDAW
jgi:hypothetical protein